MDDSYPQTRSPNGGCRRPLCLAYGTLYVRLSLAGRPMMSVDRVATSAMSSRRSTPSMSWPTASMASGAAAYSVQSRNLATIWSKVHACRGGPEVCALSRIPVSSSMPWRRKRERGAPDRNAAAHTD